MRQTHQGPLSPQHEQPNASSRYPRRWHFTLMLLGLLFASVTAAWSAAPSPLFRQNAQGTSSSAFNGPHTGVILWTFQPGYGVFGSPVIGADGIIYATDGGNLYAVNPDGRQKWAFALSGGGSVVIAPALGYGANSADVYVGSSSGTLYDIDCASGNKKWAYTAGGELGNSIVGPDGAIYPRSTDGNLYAVKADGTKKWTASIGTPCQVESPVISPDGKTIYTLPYNGYNTKLFAVATDTGTLSWTYDSTYITACCPSVGADGVIYFGDGYEFQAVDPTTHKQKWTDNKNVSWATRGVASAIGQDGTVYSGSCDGYLHAWDPATGVLKWKHYLGGSDIHSGMAIGNDGTLYCGDTYDNVFAAYDSKSGQDRWKITYHISDYNAPAIGANNVLYVSGDAGLTAIGPRPYQPDMMIENQGDATYTGDGYYNTTGLYQTVSQTFTGASTCVYPLKVRNDGINPDSFKISGTAASTGWTVKYYDALTGGNDITAQVTGAGWTTTTLAPDASLEFRLEVTGVTVTTGATESVTVTGTSVTASAQQDVVIANTTANITVVSTPVLLPPPGTYLTVQSVAITCATAGATIRYTEDGTDPTATSPVYLAPILIATDTTLKARGFAAGKQDSPVAGGFYHILPPIPIPTFTPPPGAYVSTVTVSFNDTEPGVTYYYTSDGTTPTINSTVYAGPITLTQNTTLKVYAVKSGMTDSAVATGVYTVATLPPTFTPAPGTYITSVLVTLTSATAGAAIHYTTDGTTPTATSPLYTAPLALTTTTTLQALASKAGMADSTVATGVYTLQAAKPAFSQPAGTYVSSVTVAITSATPGVAFHYTIDGTPPTAASPLYTGPVTLTATCTLQAIATKTGMSDSAVTAALYTLQAATPVFSPLPGSYTSSVAVTITSATAGAAIHYTTDGTPPTAASPLYAGPVTLTATSTLQALATKTGLLDSGVQSGLYTLGVATPTFTPDPATGPFQGTVTVTLQCATPGATIHYTLDGTPPTALSPVYGAPFSLVTTTTVKAIANKAGLGDSAVNSGFFSIQVFTPIVSPSSSVIYNAPVTVKIICSTPGADIYYTLNSSQPTTASTHYTGPLLLTKTATLMVKAVKAGSLDSNVVTVTYKFGLQAVATPTFSPPPGAYAGTQIVTLACATPGATIHYTLDPNATPTVASPIYTTALQVVAGMTIKAIAMRSDMPASAVATGAYTAAGDIYEPDGTPAQAKTILSGQPQTRSIHVPGDEDWVKFTLTTPSTVRIETTGTPANPTGDTEMWLYGPNSSVLQLDYNDDSPGSKFSLIVRDGAKTLQPGTYYIKVRAYANYASIPGYLLWMVATPVGQQTTAPLFTPAPGLYAGPVTVTMTAPVLGLIVRYTTDGTVPTGASTRYTGPVTLTSSQLLIARAFINGLPDPTLTYGLYTIMQPAATPVLTPAPGYYSGPVTVSLSCATPGASLRYTTNGTTPTTASPLYTGPLTLQASATIKAFAQKSGMTNSAVVTGVYTIVSLKAAPLAAAAPLSAVALAGSGPAAVGTPLTLTATATGGVGVEYTFLLGQQAADGSWGYTTLQTSASPVYRWVPQTAGDALLTVVARAGERTVDASLPVTVTPSR